MKFRKSKLLISGTEDLGRRSEDHKQWLSKLGRKGQAHKDNSIRNFADMDQKYLNRWELLGLD